MDLIVLIILIAFTFVFFRRIDNVIYVICIIDIFLRIVSKINSLLNISILNDIASKLPVSILGIINNYSSGIINNILVWFYIGVYVVFLGYLIKYFFKKKKHR